ncbi:hypothetical protein [Xenorhabdus taiwanensis]|uniref:Invasin n=1 Tax=Xenorhabdus taiwanensis TaxID=3085177 RepID=A0ABM8JR52_9GAMM|nr:hypothetical protein TCT1_01140 [Xenorhabdus sp. TCT-1]
MSNVNQQEEQKLDSTSGIIVTIKTIPNRPKLPVSGLYTMGVEVTDKHKIGLANLRVKLSVTDPEGNPVLGEDGQPQVYTNADGSDDTLTHVDGLIYFTPYLSLNKFQTQTGIYTISAYVEGSGMAPTQKKVEFSDK